MPAEQHHHITEQELLAVMEALKVLAATLMAFPFNLITDHKPNIFLDTQPTLSKRQTRWSEYLLRFNFTWVYRSGRTNVADPLNRKPSFRPVAAAAVTTRSRSAPQPTQPTSLTLLTQPTQLRPAAACSSH